MNLKKQMTNRFKLLLLPFLEWYTKRKIKQFDKYDILPAFKLMVMGYGRHGKDTVCDILSDVYGLSFKSSSYAAATFLYDKLKDEFGYTSVDECFNDRHNHRQRWFNEIAKLTEQDQTKLARHIFQNSAIYCGIRRLEEFEAAKKEKLFYTSIWVDASARVAPEGVESCTVTPSCAEYVLSNNGTLVDLRWNVNKLVNKIVEDFIDYMTLTEIMIEVLDKENNSSYRVYFKTFDQAAEFSKNNPQLVFNIYF